MSWRPPNSQAATSSLLQGYALSDPERRLNDWVAANDDWVIFETHKRRGPMRNLFFLLLLHVRAVNHT